MRLALVILLVAGCAQQPALVTDKRKAEAVRELQREFSRSVDSEKSAVLANKDEDSRRFVSESRAASDRVNTLREELRELGTSAEKEKLEAFDQAWAKVEAIDAKLLPLAEENTNLQAIRLSTHEATTALDQVLGTLHSEQESTNDPVRLRRLADAQIAALRIQALHAPHIASASAEEMRGIEANVTELERTVDSVGLDGAWAQYKALTAQIFQLSRENSEVRSFDISVHEKREAAKEASAALKALVDKVHDVPRPSR
jgi:hypothetical protein